MVTVTWNPVETESIFIDCLNASFGHWGDRDLYRWAFERTVGSHATDLLLIEEGGQPVAGSAVTYRNITLANDTRIHAGIMTGSWTLPEFRQQGHFARTISESVNMAAKKGAALLLAFVTKNNASYRRLTESGAALFPTYYLFSSPDSPKHHCASVVRPIKDYQQHLNLIFTRLESEQSAHARVAYTSAQWQSQFLERPGQTDFLLIEDAGMAVIEVRNDTERVRFLLPHGDATIEICVNALRARAASHGRQLLLFTASRSFASACIRSGLQQMDGYLAALVADKHNLESALRDAKAATQANSPKSRPTTLNSLGQWALQSGDRM